MKGQGYLGNTSLLEELEKLRLRQGLTISNSGGAGSILGMISAVVGGSASKIIFGGATTSITPPINGATTWTITGLSDYTYVITLNGTGLLVPGVDYTISTDTITRIGGFQFVTGEIYTIMLFSI